jgi:hypothetical protein
MYNNSGSLILTWLGKPVSIIVLFGESCTHRISEGAMVKNIFSDAKYFGSIMPAVVTLFLLGMLLLDPAVTNAEEPVKPEGTGEGLINVFFPLNSVKEPAKVTSYFVAEEDLPRGIKYPPFTVGQAFNLGIWRGEGESIEEFLPSVVINAEYQDEDLPSSDPLDEDTIQLFMYDPTTRSWNKLCSSVDIYENIVSAALSYPTPYEEKGSSLFAIALDKTPPLDQDVDGEGTTTLTLEGTDLRLQVVRDEIELGSHFVVTPLSRSAGGRSVKLFSEAVDVKACRVDHKNPTRNNQQLYSFYRVPTVGFDYDADTLARAGGRDNLTIVNLKSGDWVDMEEFGSRVRRGSQTIAVDSGSLGTFGLTVR